MFVPPLVLAAVVAIAVLAVHRVRLIVAAQAADRAALAIAVGALTLRCRAELEAHYGCSVSSLSTSDVLDWAQTHFRPLP